MVARRYENLETRVNAIASRINPIFRPEVVQDAIEELGRCLKAEKTIRSRDADGKIQYEKVPDYPIRAAVAIKIVEFEYGKAVQRSVHATVSAENGKETADTFFTDIIADPEAAKSLMETLGKLHEAAKKAVPVDVSATKALPEAKQEGS